LGLRAADPRPSASRGFGLSTYRLDPYVELHAEIPAIHVLAAAQWDELEPAARTSFLQGPWTVSAQSNRLGCRLEGPTLQAQAHREMLSHGILPGVVQLPPSGQPMVQLCDGNTSGGYPVIARVARAELHLFAQLRPGSRIRFELCDVATAAELWARRQHLLDTVEHECGFARPRPS